MSKIKVNEIEKASGSGITVPTGTSFTVTDGIAATNLSGTIADARLPTVPVTKGGTGLTSLGSAGQAIKVNSGGNALEFGTVAGGKLLQVVSNTTTTVATTTSSTYEHATNCPTLNITPAASTSKILLIAHIGSVETNGTGYFTMFRDSTNIGDSGEGFGYIQPDNTTYLGGGHHVLDEPSTSSQITYQIRIKCSGGTFTIGRSESRVSLTAIEIGA